MRHWEENSGVAPSAVEVQSWYEQQPEGTLLRAKGTAENALQAFSEEVYASALEDQEEEIRTGIIVAEIRQLRAFWPQFGVNLAGGFVSALLFAILLALVAFFVITDTSPTQIGSELREKAVEVQHGQERSNIEKGSDSRLEGAQE
jgi:sugar phosphate permease